MKRYALLVVDEVNCFFTGGELPVPQAEEVLEPTNELVRHAELNHWLIIYAREAHPAPSAKTIHFVTAGGPWPVHGVEGTFGAQFHSRLYIAPSGVVVKKGMAEDEHGYSPFDGVSELGRTLETILRASGITHVYVCGLATDYCVKNGVLDSAKRGFRTHCVIDACRAVNVTPGDGDKAVGEMTAAGALITTTTEVLNAAD